MTEDPLALFRDVTARFVTGLHEGAFRATRGRVTHTIMGMPVVLLTTKGRRSGEDRSVMLTAALLDDHRVVLVASNRGADKHPAWYLNVRADPRVRVLHDGTERDMRARIAGEEERARLWPAVVAAFAGYGWYQERTDRQVPVVVLEP